MTMKPDSVVLVVEDEEDSRESLRELLELEGYMVQTAVNGKEALERLDALEPCVMLLDLCMPVMDGWQMLDQLRSDGRLGRFNIVITTSAAYKAPPGHLVFEKPLDLNKLMRAVAAVC